MFEYVWNHCEGVKYQVTALESSIHEGIKQKRVETTSSLLLRAKETSRSKRVGMRSRPGCKPLAWHGPFWKRNPWFTTQKFTGYTSFVRKVGHHSRYGSEHLLHYSLLLGNADRQNSFHWLVHSRFRFGYSTRKRETNCKSNSWSSSFQKWWSL